jgi:peptidoglycan hydrolase CwlO-like protein
MGLFRRKGKVIDLSESMRKKQEKIDQLKEDLRGNSPPKTPSSLIRSDSEGSFFSFLGNNPIKPVSSSEESSSPSYDNSDAEEKKRKLTKRLSDITTKLEDLSNSIYKIEQRLELIERKMNLGKY